MARQTSENSSFGSPEQDTEGAAVNYRFADLTVGRSDLSHLAEDQFGGISDMADQLVREDAGLRASRLG